MPSDITKYSGIFFYVALECPVMIKIFFLGRVDWMMGGTP